MVVTPNSTWLKDLFTSRKELTKMTVEKLRNYVNTHGEVKDKKHGNWIKLTVDGENTFFELDTWNGALAYKVRSGEYNYHTGFKGHTFIYFGCDSRWGGLCSAITLNMAEYYYEKANIAIANRKIREM